jgi:hypothetical protein
MVEHPKLIAAGGDAGWLHICAMSWSARNMTDGFIPDAVVSRLSDRKQPGRLAVILERERLWERVENGWKIHDWDDYQLPATRTRQRMDDVSRQRRQASAVAHHRRWHESRGIQADDCELCQTDAFGIPLACQTDAVGMPPLPLPLPIPKGSTTTTTVETVAEGRSSSSSGMNQPSVITEAVALAVEVAAMHTDGIRSPGRWRKRVAETIATEHGEAMRAHVAERPGISAGQLVQAVLGATDIDVARARQLRGAS